MKRCVACGHTAADHPDGVMGARVDDDWYCHQDDHSCYVQVSLPEGLPQGLEQLLRAVDLRF